MPDNQWNITNGWGPTVGDQRETFNTSAIYRLKYGFQVAGLFRAGSGSAYAVTAGSSPFFNGTSSNRTFLSTLKTYNRSTNNHPSIAPGYSTVDRDSFYGRPIYRVDGRLQKTFSLGERYRIVLMGEVFNFLNHPNYGSYTTDITSPQFGNPTQNTSLSYSPRTFQLAARFEF